MKIIRIKIIVISTLFVLMPVSSQATEEKIKGRWYTQNQVDKGRIVYNKTCLVCHGTNAQGLTQNWKIPLADGAYPPPPLSGSAHTWHHPLRLLKRTINKGGIPLGGKMPAFENILNEQEKSSVIAYFQDLWSDEIYNAWLKRGGLK